MKPNAIKLLEEEVGGNLGDPGLGKDFLDRTQKHDPLKETDKLSFIKMKNICYSKDTVKRMKRQASDGEKILAKRDLYAE